ncbi:hypothetical protein WA026_009882 [Henosepilachna vigintioctopunctata]|uniref:Glucuronosyltransferase n=1 Tax=Henosepilachna vigintioctopunctata TaxID=420089 RepID=A0AAW1TT18_9CUCU
MEDQMFSFDDPYITKPKYFKWKNANILLEKGLKSCQSMFSNPNVQKIIKSRRKFDVILAEYFTGECIHGFHYKFGAPLIGVSSTAVMPLYSRRLFDPDNPSYIVNNLFSLQDEMSFCERTANFFGTWYFKLYHMSYLRDNKNLIERYFNMKIPSITTNNNSILLVNSQASITPSTGLVPRVVNIGGVHINASSELPKDIQEFYQKFAYVVYVSMGTMVKGHTFPVKQRDIIIEICRQYKFGLLWKWDGEYRGEIPSHMMVKKWFPQRDILAHSRTVIFVSHAGLLSVIEALNYGFQ